MKNRLLIILPFLILTVLFTTFTIWAYTPLGPMPEALAALTSDNEVEIADRGGWWEFSPVGGPAIAGLVLYPGGRVDWRSYAPIAKGIARHGFLVALVPMPFNLAVFSPQKGGEVIAAYPHIRKWAIGGHSLGGAMAANFVSQNPGLVDGLVLWAAYPAENQSLRNIAVEVISIYGSEDGLATVEVVETARNRLPEDTNWVQVLGGNHAQFGWYGDQPGDGTALLSREEQQSIILTETVRFLEQFASEGDEK